MLYQLSQRILCIPATSAPSERVFSLAALVISMRRARLDDELASDLVCLRENSHILGKWWYELKNENRYVLPGSPIVATRDDIDVGL